MTTFFHVRQHALVLIFRNESGIWKISHSSISIPYYLVREEEVYPLKELKERNQLLEDLVAERTIQLSMSNDNLQMINIELAKEIEERKQAEESELNIKKQYDSLVFQNTCWYIPDAKQFRRKSYTQLREPPRGKNVQCKN